MNNPLDPKHVANENTFEEENITAPLIEEKEESTVTTNEESRSLMESAEEAPVEIPDKEEIPAEEKDKPEEVVTESVLKEDEEEKVKEEPPAETSKKEIQERLDKSQIVERLAVVVGAIVSESTKMEVDALKQAFYKLKRTEIEEEKKIFLSSGGEEADFVQASDETEEKLKEHLLAFREKKSSLTAETEKTKEDNLKAKKAIVEQLKELIESQDDFYKVYNEFRKLQQQWKEIKAVPQASMNELWKAYQHYSEKFYDLLKINNEMRDYDFKKNVELKEALCETVEKLDEEKDVISAFYQLQKLHQDWREIGPVAREFREEIWDRFKKASSAINKKHQDHFEALRSLEQRNLEEKTTICEEMETIHFDVLTNFKEWDEKNRRVLDLQDKWKAIGFAPKKYNIKIFERFRAACDTFFQKKSDFYKGIKEIMDENLEHKKALCEKAETLKENQDWKETTDKLITLQKEWKTIGPVSRKHSDAIWKRFISACDYFFEQKNTHFSSQKTEEVENLKIKKELIERINRIDNALSSAEAVALIRGIMSEWNNVGFVPFKEKDKTYKEYREAIDKHFERLKIDESERRLQSFKSNLSTEISGGSDKSKNRLLSERERLMRTYERLKNDIQTYENNIGFLSVSSKGGGGLVKDMNRKIDSLKEELVLIIKKIELIDENLGFEK